MYTHREIELCYFYIDDDHSLGRKNRVMIINYYSDEILQQF